MAPRRILFLTNSDYGQSNVVLATAHAMLQHAPEVEVNIASQTGLEKSVLQLNAPNEPTPTFHLIKGLTHSKAVMRPHNPGSKTYNLPPGFANTTRSLRGLVSIMHPWLPTEWTDIYRDIQRIYEEVQPEVTVIDAMLSPALSFAHHASINWVSLVPNVLKDFALPMQPRLQVLWKYPIFCSGIPFPVPWYLIPLNIWYNLVVGFAIFTEKISGRIQAAIDEELGPDIKIMTMYDMGLTSAPEEGLKILVSNSRDIDFPLEVIPKYTIPCGPILRAAAPIATVDPELATWLRRRPTILVNLGTHMHYTLERAKELAFAFRIFLDRAVASGRGVEYQILWKMPRLLTEEDDPDNTKFTGRWLGFTEILGSEIEKDQARILHWLTAEPKSIMECGNVVCSMSHGGANSFHEALCAAVPQVALPGWADCYDYACRAELNGVGEWANKKAKGTWERNEVAESLEEVIIGPKAVEYQQTANAVAKRHPENEGRERAAREILALGSRT